MMENNTKYLKVTIHDNDFTTTLIDVCKELYTLFQEESFPDETDFPTMEKYIQQMFFGGSNLRSFLRWKNTHITFEETQEKYFTPQLMFVDYLDIPDWDNYESVFIPMFENSEIVIR